MNPSVIDRTIHKICEEIISFPVQHDDWRFRDEEELLYEACVCIFSSQMIFEVAEAGAQALKRRGLLSPVAAREEMKQYAERIIVELAKPFPVIRGGEERNMRIRFRNRLAALLASTLDNMNVRGESLGGILLSSSSGYEARENLIEHVSGFGPKQASLFLRRVGYCSELAVLDTHILDYLDSVRNITPNRNTLSSLSGYEFIESEFRKIAKEFGYPVDCVDLAMWITVRVAKREAMW